jgi:hypothetical protein
MNHILLLLIFLTISNASIIIDYRIARPSVLIKKFAHIILNGFHPERIRNLQERIDNSVNVTSLRLRSDDSIISFFSNIPLNYSKSGSNGLQIKGETSIFKTGSIYRVFSKYQESSEFIQKLVSLIHSFAIQKKSSQYLSVYHFIKGLSGLEKYLAYLSLPNFPFDEMCDLLLRFTTGVKIDPKIVDPFLNRIDVNEVLSPYYEFVQEWCRKMTHIQCLSLLPFSLEELSYSAGIIKHIRNRKVIPDPKIEEIKSFFSTPYDPSVLFVTNKDNWLVQRLINCVRRLSDAIAVHDLRVELIPLIVERNPTLRCLDENFRWIISRYLTTDAKHFGLSKDYVLFSQLSPVEKQSLNKFVGIVDDNGGFCSEDPIIVKESIISLGIDAFYDSGALVPVKDSKGVLKKSLFRLAKLFIPFFVNPDLPYEKFLASLMEEEANFPDLTKALDDPLLFGPEENQIECTYRIVLNEKCTDVFSILIHCLGNNHYLLIYYISRLVEGLILPGSDPLLQFLFLRSHSTPVFTRIYRNLLNAKNNRLYDFGYLFKYFSPGIQVKLIVLNPKDHPGKWCQTIFLALEIYYSYREFRTHLERESELGFSQVPIHLN